MPYILIWEEIIEREVKSIHVWCGKGFLGSEYYLPGVKCPVLPLGQAPGPMEVDASLWFAPSFFPAVTSQITQSLCIWQVISADELPGFSACAICGFGERKELIEALSSASPMGEAVCCALSPCLLIRLLQSSYSPLWCYVASFRAWPQLFWVEYSMMYILPAFSLPVHYFFRYLKLIRIHGM